MSDPADIENVSMIDFSKGFQHFIIQWPLNHLNVPKRSSQFETKVVCGNQSATLSWSLCIGNYSEDPTKTQFVARLRNSDTIIPIIYRICLSSYENVLFDQTDLAIMDSAKDCGHVMSTSEVEKFFDDGGLALNMWIDIPKAIALGNNYKKKLLCARESVAGFLSDHAEMFSRVVGTESDASSDVALIIIDNEGKELRRFQCHTIFLVSRSSVFERMFASDNGKEICTKNDRSVKIGDISEQVMETVLRFIYTSELPDMSTKRAHLCNTIYAAEKYDLEMLKNWCISHLIYDSHLNTLEHLVPNRYKQLLLSDRHNLVQLKSVCLAQLSLCFPIGFFDHTFAISSRRGLWSETMNAVFKRQAHTSCIVLPAA